VKVANPYLNFRGNTREAFTFYKSVFGGEFSALITFKEFGGEAMKVPPRELDKIMHVALPIGNGTVLMGSDVLESQKRPVKAGNNFYIALEAENGGEAERVFNALAAGGKSEMPLQKTQWAEKYGMCVDKFGIGWMVSYTGNVRYTPGN
jgi:PhnB protein